MSLAFFFILSQQAYSLPVSEKDVCVIKVNKKCSHKKPLQAEIEITGVSPGEYRLSKPQALEYQEIKLINVYIFSDGDFY